MGQTCCCSQDRKDDFAHANGNGAAPPQTPGADSRRTDADLFDIAFEQKDVKAFVRLMESTEPIEPLPERMHPWAADPKTVGPLAATQLAILSSMADSDRKVEIKNAGAIPLFKKYLESKEDDRLQTAIVALSFLSTDNVMCAQAIHDEGCMKLLVPHLNAPIQGMRGAVASTLRNMYVLGPEAKDEFLKLGGLNRLVEQLKLDKDNSDICLEAILNIDDLIEDDDANVDTKMIEELKKLGVKNVLQTVLQTQMDPEVQAQASELLEKLEG